MKTDCDFINFIEDLSAKVTSMTSLWSVAANVARNTEPLNHDVFGLPKAFMEKDYFVAGKSIGEIVAILFNTGLK